MHDNGRKVHPYVPELYDLLMKGAVGRREFLRTATLLGLSAGTAYALVGQLGGGLVAPARAQAKPQSGGILRFSQRVQEMTDPATFDWTEKSNQARHIIEYLTITGTDNVTRPYLAERWEASDDLKTWTLYLRRGVKWSNGDDFTADDVVHNFRRWLDPKTGSSNIGLFAGMTDEVEVKDAEGKTTTGQRMREGAVEKVDAHTVRLHLKRPELAIPENLYNYPTAIVHRSFDDTGADLSKNPIGTGPFQLVEYKVGQSYKVARRDGYWGDPAYLDGIHYIDHGDDFSARLNALISGQVDGVYELDVNQIDIIGKFPNLVLSEAITAQTGVARMQVDQKPFDDVRVRRAIQAATDRAKILEVAYRGRGAVAQDHHVSPIHPEHFALPAIKQDYALAKKLLAEAGHGDGLTVKIDLGQADAWHTAAMQAFKQQLEPAGITLNLNIMPGASYWDVWDKTPFGFTQWTHRPLGVMVLNLGYRSGVPWNESRYANPAFDAALDEATGTLDVAERTKKMEKVQKILQEDAVMVQPLWRAVFSAVTDKVHGYETHPTFYHDFRKVWMS